MGERSGADTAELASSGEEESRSHFDPATIWYRRVEAVGRYRETGPRGRLMRITLSHEEPMCTDYSEHVSNVARMLETAGVDDDMGATALDGSDLSITFTVTYRGEAAEPKQGEPRRLAPSSESPSESRPDA